MNLNLLFTVFSFALVFSAFMVIFSKHPVFCLLFLVGCFIFSSFLLLLLECEFLAFLFIVVYVGAIAVLFLFAIMMLEPKSKYLSQNATKYMPIGFLFVTTFVLVVLILLQNQFDSNVVGNSFYSNKYFNWYDLIDSVNDIEVFGQVLYSYFVLHFLAAGFILLMVLIGIVYLTNNFNKSSAFQQSIFKQLSRNSDFFKNLNRG
uniref:NADH-ubiquinone oxidoreductase chain 6 n=1 Tax=Proschkinia sp. SZCZR1824 TaxID=2588390 RepID=A0A4Y5SDY7_9STRA|nr:NADH dehydrogenase subunit 6 [Proschkinia sp. SZCZR1824]